MITLTLTDLCLGQGLNGGDAPSYTIRGVSQGHKFAVTIRQARFDPKGRKLIWIVQDQVQSANGEPRLHELRSRKDWDGEYSSIYVGFKEGTTLYRFYFDDGREYGQTVGKKPLDTLKHAREITSVEVTLDGRTLKLPNRLYWDLLNPNLGPSYVRATYSVNHKSLRIGLMGSEVPEDTGSGGRSMPMGTPRAGMIPLTERPQRFRPTTAPPPSSFGPL